MELILLKDIEKVGRKGEIVRVRDGFGRNFLLPRRLGLALTKANEQFVQELKTRSETKREKQRLQAVTQAEKLGKLKLTIEAKAGEQDKLFGAVTNEHIHAALAKKGFEIDKKHIRLEESIHTLGTYPVVLELFPQVKATVTVEVVRKV